MRKLKQDFSKAAPSYDDHAHLQRACANNLIERLQYFSISPKNILDLGSGTGFLSNKLKKMYPKAKVTGVDIADKMCQYAKEKYPAIEFICANIYDLPLPANHYDFIISNFTLQWCDDLPTLFTQILKVASPDASFLFSTVGLDSLKELRTCWAAVDSHPRVKDFQDMHNIGDALLQTGWQQPVMDIDRLCYYYENYQDIFDEFKGLGVANKDKNRLRGLTGKSKLKHFSAEYEKLRTNKGLPLSWEVVYGFCKKSAGVKFTP